MTSSGVVLWLQFFKFFPVCLLKISLISSSTSEHFGGGSIDKLTSNKKTTNTYDSSSTDNNQIVNKAKKPIVKYIWFITRYFYIAYWVENLHSIRLANWALQNVNNCYYDCSDEGRPTYWLLFSRIFPQWFSCRYSTERNAEISIW